MRGVLSLLAGVAAVAAWSGVALGQPCPSAPPCGRCEVEVATATCKPRAVATRQVAITSTPSRAEIHVSVNGRGLKRQGSTPRTLTFKPRDEVVIELRLDGHTLWRHTLAPDERALAAVLEPIGTVTVDAAADPAMYGAEVEVQCRQETGSWALCWDRHTQLAPQGRVSLDAPATLRFPTQRPARVVVKRAGHEHHTHDISPGEAYPGDGQAWPARARTFRVSPRLVVRSAVTDEFTRAAPGSGYRGSAAYSIDGSALRAQDPQGRPLWATTALPAEAIVEVEAWAVTPGSPIRLHVWGDGRWNPGGGGRAGYILHLATDGGRSVLARDDEARGPRADRVASAPARAGHRHKLRIVRRGSTVTWYVDDLIDPFLTLEDPGGPAASTPGFLGFSGATGDVRFDNLRVTPLSLATGRVRIESNVPAKIVGVTGRPDLATPFEAEWKVDHHTLTIEAAGFQPYRLAFEVKPGTAQRLIARLERPPIGILRVSASVPATMRMMGNSGWSRAVAGPGGAPGMHELEPGTYQLVISAGGHADALLTVHITAGQTASHHVTLERLPERTVVTGHDEPARTATFTPPEPPAADRPSRKLDLRVVQARSEYVRALEQRDAIGHVKVRRGLRAGLFGVCTVGGIGLNLWGASGGSEDLGTNLGAIFAGAVVGGACYWGLLQTVIKRRYGVPSSHDADRRLAAARADLTRAIASHGGSRSSLLRRPAPRLGFGVTLADGLAFGDSTEHSGLAIEGGLHTTWRWLHPELALELDTGSAATVLRPGLRGTLGRWFFVRGAYELPLSGDGDAAVFGGLGVDLWFAKHVAFELATDYSHALAEEGGRSHLRLRTGIRYGL